MIDPTRASEFLPPRLRQTADLQEKCEAKVKSALERDDFETVRTVTLEAELSFAGVWEVLRDRLTVGDITETSANRFIDTLLDAKPDYFDGDENVDMDHGRAVGHVVGLLGRLDIIDKLIVPERGETTDGTFTAAGIVQGLGHKSNEAGFEYTRSRIVHFPEAFRRGIEAQFANGLPTAV